MNDEVRKMLVDTKVDSLNPETLREEIIDLTTHAFNNVRYVYKEIYKAFIKMYQENPLLSFYDEKALYIYTLSYKTSIDKKDDKSYKIGLNNLMQAYHNLSGDTIGVYSKDENTPKYLFSMRFLKSELKRDGFRLEINDQEIKISIRATKFLKLIDKECTKNKSNNGKK